jgi:hypothetical protein
MAYPPPPYKDAVVGTFVAGEAIVGRWWAYPPQAGLGLAGIPPGLTIVNGPDVTVVPPTALLGLAATPPAFQIDQSLPVPQPSLLLLGVVPDRVGFVWLPSEEDVLGWVPSLVGSVTFDQVVADEIGWIPSQVD